MDEIVHAAMEKWPDVPALFHWLSLDARGRWRLRGDPITNPALCNFIGRNYASDATGRWFFQNGPQRVYVRCEAAPWILNVEAEGLRTHTGQLTRPTGFMIDEDGHLYARTEKGLGKINDRDLSALAEHITELSDGELQVAVSGERWAIERVSKAELPARFGFDPDPGPETDVDADQPRP